MHPSGRRSGSLQAPCRFSEPGPAALLMPMLVPETAILGSRVRHLGDACFGAPGRGSRMLLTDSAALGGGRGEPLGRRGREMFRGERLILGPARIAAVRSPAGGANRCTAARRSSALSVLP